MTRAPFSCVVDPRLRPAEARVLARVRSPRDVQRWVDGLAYNREDGGETLHTFRGVVRTGKAHCAEAALAAAFLLERLGHRPRLIDMQSPDYTDHWCALWRGPDGRWGAVGQSKYPGLRGRKAMYASPAAVVRSYTEPFVDATGEVEAWADYDLSRHPREWRWNDGNAWHVQHAVNATPHRRVRVARERVDAMRARYMAWKQARGLDPADHSVEPPVGFYRGLARVVL